jgi:hypothetical protein
MLAWLIKRRIDAFERVYGYDASYLRDMLAADVKAVMALWKVQGLARYRKGVPLEPLCAAGLVGALAEDCGPCTQLGITMAEREGVAADTLRAIVAGDMRAMPDDVALALGSFSTAAVVKLKCSHSVRTNSNGPKIANFVPFDARVTCPSISQMAHVGTDRLRYDPTGKAYVGRPACLGPVAEKGTTMHFPGP